MTTVMIVEDREMISDAIREMLLVSGYEVSGIASGGKEALEKYPAIRPDIVLMDLLLPDISGLEVAREILRIDPAATFLAITAVTKDGLIEECMEAGFKGLIRKPFRMKELLSSIESALGNG
ncbi:MAG: response regulator [Thermoplasmatota archaeon]